MNNDNIVGYVVCKHMANIIAVTLEENEQLVTFNVIEKGFDLLKFVKLKMSKIDEMDKFIIDIAACSNVSDEIIQALEQIRSLNDELRIIIISTERQVGDELLAKIFGLGINNIICTEDYGQIRSELIKCLNGGKSFREALPFRDVKKENIIIKSSIKQTVEKIMIGVAGSEQKIGVTHNSIILANFLRKKGFMIALAEYKPNGELAFETIRNSFDEKLIENLYFTLGGIDYYENCDQKKMCQILSRAYNFIIVDFGEYNSCEKIEYHKCNERIMITGAEPWQVNKLDIIFDELSDKVNSINFCFNHVQDDLKKDVLEGMKPLEKVYFLKYSESSFDTNDFGGAEEFLKKYMPIEIEEKEEKKVFFISRFRGKRKERRQKKKNEQN